MVRKTPQEKKRLSYAKDRRNAYGENDKSSRKNIPRSRRHVHRANRRRAQTILADATGRPTAVDADAAEQRLLGSRPKAWRKWPDMPLGEYVAWKLSRRVSEQQSQRPPA